MSRISIVVIENDNVILEKEFSSFPITFGRNPSSQVSLPYEFVSRSHCTLVEEDEGIALIDMHSSHGVVVDGRKIDRIIINKDLTFSIKNLTIQVLILNDKLRKNDDHDTLKTAIQTATAPVDEIPQKRKSPLPPTMAAKSPKPVFVPAANATSRGVTTHVAPRPSSLRVQPPLTESYVDGGRIPMVEKDFRPVLLGPHPTAPQAQFKKIEATVSWYDVIYDIQEFDPEDKITVGPLGKGDIAVPIFRRSMTVAKVGRDRTKCYALIDHKVTLANNNGSYNASDLIEKNILNQRGQKYVWTMAPLDVTTIDFGAGVQLHLRYVPGTRALSRHKMIEPDEAIKQSLIGSAILHVALALIIFLMAPAGRVGPNLKNVPQRYARLLVEKPKPKPTPVATPPPKEVAKKEPPKPVEKVVEKKPKPMKLPKVLAKKNKFPIEVKHPIAKAPPPVKVEALGALGALGAMSKTAAPNVVTNININPNAGGLPQKAMNTGGIAGALPSSNGKLAAAGGARVKTKGFGYGTGTGYGIQGLKGTAGTRGVAGAIVGEPKLAALAKVEGITRAQVMSVLKQYMGEIQHCYEKNLLANPDLAGRIDFEWDIAPGGNVTDVRVKRSTVNNGDGLVECVRKVFSSMPFPKAKNGMITTPTIGFPFGRI